MNKIISMSVYGDNPRYITGAKKQTQLANIFYSDWEVRIYTDNAKNFLDTNANIIEKQKHQNGVFWRFEPLFESGDNITIVRDSDGRITEREEMAVKEWLASSKTFHTFRDHEAHFEFPIIACAFGLKGRLPDSIKIIMNAFINKPFYYTNDQVFLRDYVWPYVEKNALVHTMNEGWFGETRKSLNNPYEFCGNGWDEDDYPLYPNTLEACRGFNKSMVSEKDKYSWN